MTMTRQHFEVIAAAMKYIAERKAKGRRQAEIMADALAGTNKLFDRDRFMEACGYPPKDDTCALCDEGLMHEH